MWRHKFRELEKQKTVLDRAVQYRDSDRFTPEVEQWCNSVLQLLEMVFGIDSDHYCDFNVALKESRENLKFEKMSRIFLFAKAVFESEYLSNSQCRDLHVLMSGSVILISGI